MYFKTMIRKTKNTELQLLMVCKAELLRNVVKYIGIHNFQGVEIQISEITDKEYQECLRYLAQRKRKVNV